MWTAQDYSILIGAIAAFIVAVGGTTIQLLTFWRAGTMMTLAKARDVKIHEIATAVDGLTEKRVEEAHVAGVTAGQNEERARATVLEQDGTVTPSSPPA